MYVFDDSLGNVKIGWALDPWRRMETISAGSPGKLTLVYFREMSEQQAKRVERKAHRDLKSQRIWKEWFRATVLEAVAAIDRALQGTPLERDAAVPKRICPACRNPVSVKLRPALLERLAEMAEEDNRSVGNFIAYRLRMAMDRIEADHRAEIAARGRRGTA